MKKIFLYTVYTVVFALSSNAQNLVLNGGFETAVSPLPGGTSVPPYPAFLDDWSAANTDGEFIFDLTLAHTGTGFFSVLQNAGACPQTYWLGAASVFGGYDRVLQIIPVTASTTYQFSCWIRSGNSLRYSGYSDGNALIQIEEFAPVPAPLDSVSFFTPPSWGNLTRTFTTGPSCTAIAILFSGYSVNNVDVWVDDVSLTTETGFNNNYSGSYISVSPNPFEDELIVYSTKKPGIQLPVKIKMFDVSGREVLSKELSVNRKLITVNLNKGIYFVYIYTADGIEIKKVVKQ